MLMELGSVLGCLTSAVPCDGATSILTVLLGSLILNFLIREFNRLQAVNI